MKKIEPLSNITNYVKDGMSVMVGGFMGCGTPEPFIDLLVKQNVKDLTIICNDAGYPEKGVGKLIVNNQVSHLIASHIGLNPDAGKQMSEGSMKVTLVPQGTLAEQIRAAGAGLGGILTPTGVGTIVEEGKEKGYVTTIMHRRRYIPELNSSVYMQREQGKRNAQNAPVQGSAADIIKLAMIKLDEALTKKQMKSKMLLQIHDELVFDCVPSEQQKLKEMIKDIMENCIELDVPLKVDTASGNNLFETK